MILGAGTTRTQKRQELPFCRAHSMVSAFQCRNRKVCNRYRIPRTPGAMTIKEVVEAMSGADIMRSRRSLCPKILKAIKGPIPYAKMILTGGRYRQRSEWIKAAPAVMSAVLTVGQKQAIIKSLRRLQGVYCKRQKQGPNVACLFIYYKEGGCR